MNLQYLKLTFVAFVVLAHIGTVSAEPQKLAVSNGASADEGEWPWMVAILQRGDDPSLGTVMCGGTVIHERFILTAAHCISDFSASEIEVLIGRTTLSSGIGRRVAVEKIYRYPGYDPFFNSTYNDVALLRLADPALVDPLALIEPGQEALWEPDTNATILGWGQTDPNFPILPDTLQEAQVPIVSDASCAETHGLLFQPLVMVCAGKLASSDGANDEVDSQPGDSGGPLLVHDGATWRQIGITSWGYIDGADRFASVYTRVLSFRDWIESKLNVASTVRDSLTELPRQLAIALGVKRTGKRAPQAAQSKKSARTSVRRAIRDLKDSYESFQPEIRAALPRFTRKKLLALSQAVTRALSLQESGSQKQQLRTVQKLCRQIQT